MFFNGSISQRSIMQIGGIIRTHYLLKATITVPICQMINGVHGISLIVEIHMAYVLCARG
uniref:Uncharacterized protein n=1 Tax=Ascaris lumbricoides TaxID=6252 RepID=A0A0M3IW00_ASCLU